MLIGTLKNKKAEPDHGQISIEYYVNPLNDSVLNIGHNKTKIKYN